MPATPQHAKELAANMRAEDIAEAWAADHSTPEEILARALQVSRDTKAGTADGKVLCMFGVHAPIILSNYAAIWMLSSTELPKYARGFLRHSRAVVQQALTVYPELVNVVDARYTAAVRWLQWLGADIKPPIPWGPSGLPFHPFAFRRA